MEKLVLLPYNDKQIPQQNILPSSMWWGRLGKGERQTIKGRQRERDREPSLSQQLLLIS